MRVFDGTTSVRTADPPTPVRSTSGDVRPELGAGERGLVSARAPADDRDALLPLELIGHGAILSAVAATARPNRMPTDGHPCR